MRPTPEQAFEALSEGRCMFSPANACSGSVALFGIRGDDDGDDLLVCRAHFGRLRRLDESALETYGRHLARAFAAKRNAEREPEPEPVSWPRVMSR